VTAELIDTEFKYVCDLKTLINVFLSPLKKDKSILPDAEITSIFSNIEMIFQLNEELYKSLKINFNETLNSRDSSEIGQGKLGKVFLNLADYLKIYTLYCNNHNNSLERHKACRKKI